MQITLNDSDPLAASEETEKALKAAGKASEPPGKPRGRVRKIMEKEKEI